MATAELASTMAATHRIFPHGLLFVIFYLSKHVVERMMICIDAE
jgi:hypothetical protein